MTASSKPPFAGERVPFASVFRDVTRSVGRIRNGDYLRSGRFPIVDQGQEQVAGYSNGEEGLCEDVPAIVFGDHTRCVKHVDFPFFAGEDALEHCVSQLKQASRRYAKRQLTWFRHMDGVVWLEAGSPGLAGQALRLAQTFLHEG